MLRKILSTSVIKSSGVGEREIRAIASTSSQDRDGDIMIAAGCNLTDYKRNPVVLWQHDPDHPIGRADATINGTRIEALIQFAPAGASRKADEACALMKAGIVNTLSVGFEPTETEPIRGGGYKIIKWTLLEISVCSIPANPEAVVTQKFYGGPGHRRSPEMAKAIREAEMRNLARIGQEQAEETLRALQASPGAFAKALRVQEAERVLSMSAKLYDQDPATQRTKRMLEIYRLRGGR